MSLIEKTFKTEEGFSIRYRLYPRDGARAVFLILHGQGEHSGRYHKFAAQLSDLPLVIAAMDHRGHGMSEGPDVDVPTFESYLDDVDRFLDALRLQHNLDLPVIVFGHSLGGLIAVHWALRNQGRLRALVLSSPCFGLKLPAPARWLNRMLLRIAPGFCYQNPVYPPHLSHSEEEIREHRADPLIKRKISVRLLDQMLSYMARLEALENIRLEVPCFILASGMERVVDLDRTKAFYDNLKAPDKKLDLFPGFYHEIFNELGQQKAFDALKAVLRRVV